MADTIKVSILCITYNQAKYVRQTLDGFVTQKTHFNFEILINDDASKDGTVKIIQEYQKKYPDIIKPNFQSENRYSKGDRGFFARYLLPKARGQYIALCEGDDYWIDPEKLQKQVDFLDQHPDYSMCFHPAKVIYENGEMPDSIFPQESNNSAFNTTELLRDNYIQTNSVMYRRQKNSRLKVDVMPADWYLHLYYAQFGKIGFIDDVMSVYRRHPGGIWWGSHNNAMSGIYREHYPMLIRLYQELLKMHGNKKENVDIIHAHVSYLIDRLIEIDASEHTAIIEDSMRQFPDLVCNYVVAKKNSLESAHSEIKTLRNEVNIRQKALEESEKRLQQIVDSRRYKAAKALARPIDTLKKARRHPGTNNKK